MLPGCSISNADGLSQVMEETRQADVRDGLASPSQQQGLHSGVPQTSGSRPIVIEAADSDRDEVESMDEFDMAERAAQGLDPYVVPKNPLGTQEVIISIPAESMDAWNKAVAEGAGKSSATSTGPEPANVGSAESLAAAAASSAAVARCIALDAHNIHDRSMGVGMERHNFPVVSDEDLLRDGPVSGVSGGSFRITIPEMVLPAACEFRRTFDVTGDALEFVMVARRDESEDWYIPSMQVFADVVNSVQMSIFDNHMRISDVLYETKNWGGVGVMILRVSCPIRLARWRRVLAKIDFDGKEFNSFPKNSLQTKSKQVSMLLRDGLRYFRLEWLPMELKKRNSLRGKMTVVFSKVYGIKEKTRLGVSKYGWRLVIANVDDVFLEAVKVFPPGHGFKVGASTVMIRELNLNYMPIIPPDSAAASVNLQQQQPQQPPIQVQVQPLPDLETTQMYEVLVPVESGQFQPQQLQPVDVSQDQEQVRSPASQAALGLQSMSDVPDLLRAISSPIPPEQARARAGPDSRGGRGRRARDAASAAARRAYGAVLNPGK